MFKMKFLIPNSNNNFVHRAEYLDKKYPWWPRAIYQNTYNGQQLLKRRKRRLRFLIEYQIDGDAIGIIVWHLII